jgi:hypothetical protein
MYIYIHIHLHIQVVTDLMPYMSVEEEEGDENEELNEEPDLTSVRSLDLILKEDPAVDVVEVESNNGSTGILIPYSLTLIPYFYVYMYIYIYVHTCIYIYIYIYMDLILNEEPAVAVIEVESDNGSALIP